MWQAMASAEPPAATDLIDHRLAIRLLTAGDDGMRTLRRQQLCDFLADAAAGAGDEGDLAG